MNSLTEPFSCKELHAYLSEQLIPAVHGPSPVIVSGVPPLQAVQGVKVEVRQAPLLRNTKPYSGFTHAERWPEEGLNSSRFACFIAVLEGEADLEIGVTRRMAAQNAALSSKCSRFIITLRASSFLILPPRLPFSDASRPHWDPSRDQPSTSSLLWGHIMPSGVSFHVCHSEGDRHFSPPSLFIHDLQIHALMEMLLDEVPMTTEYSDLLKRSYLSAMLLRLDRAVVAQSVSAERRLELSHHELTDSIQDPATDSSATVQRACRYIESHMNERLTVNIIAARTYVSVPHLNRLFQEEKDMAIMQYVTHQRISRAQALLRETDLPVRRIAEVVGFPSHDHFGRIFRRETGSTPSTFRRYNK